MNELSNKFLKEEFNPDFSPPPSKETTGPAKKKQKLNKKATNMKTPSKSINYSGKHNASDSELFRKS